MLCLGVWGGFEPLLGHWDGNGLVAAGGSWWFFANAYGSVTPWPRPYTPPNRSDYSSRYPLADAFLGSADILVINIGVFKKRNQMAYRTLTPLVPEDLGGIY